LFFEEASMRRFPRNFFAVVAAAAVISVGCSVSTIAQSLAAATPSPVIVARILGNLSSRDAKVGDLIAAKTLRAFKLQDGTAIPKGSKIVGKVAAVQSRKEGNGDSLLTFRFDQIAATGGVAVPIHALVVAIGPAMAPRNLFGANSVMRRAGTSSSGVEPGLDLGSPGARDEDDIPLGSTLQGVGLRQHMETDWTTVLRGIKTEVDLDSDVRVKVQLK
jgi:hypothetical protein